MLQRTTGRRDRGSGRRRLGPAARNRRAAAAFVALLLASAAACTAAPADGVAGTWQAGAAATPADLPPGAEARSLLGEILFAPPVDAEALPGLRADLAAARETLAADPRDVEAAIWLGRRLGYLGRFREAVEVFSRCARDFPGDPRAWRYRGHRWITLRRFDLAIGDLRRAAALIAGTPDEVEPSGTPNARGIDLDTLHENVWYHLALAHYLRAEFAEALDDYRRCRDTVRNDDGRAMCAYWIANCLGRLGRGDELPEALAVVDAGMDIVEYHAYHQLALLWKGVLEPEALMEGLAPVGETAIDYATRGYGLGNWYWCRGEHERALAIWSDVARAPAWHAFGRIAAEAEIARRER